MNAEIRKRRSEFPVGMTDWYHTGSLGVPNPAVPKPPNSALGRDARESIQQRLGHKVSYSCCHFLLFLFFIWPHHLLSVVTSCGIRTTLRMPISSIDFLYQCNNNMFDQQITVSNFLQTFSQWLRRGAAGLPGQKVSTPCTTRERVTVDNWRGIEGKGLLFSHSYHFFLLPCCCGESGS